MARILVVYYRSPTIDWRSTYESHVKSLEHYSDHDCLYLNIARSRIPRYLASFRPDLIVFHYTLLAWRQRPDDFRALVERISYLAHAECPKALIPHDEQSRSDLICWFARRLNVTHVFTPAPPHEWPRVYEGLDLDAVTFESVLTGYVDDSEVRRIGCDRDDGPDRPIDVGYRSWSIRPSFGRHGALKGTIGLVFQERAPQAELVADISLRPEDAFFGDSWIEFLQHCKYTLGVEGGSSIFDRDGSIAERTAKFTSAHPGATFEEIEDACFPGMDGGFDYRLLGPRHFEAIMTRTCQVLLEGDYQGVLRPSEHYIELKRDFGNLDEVLERMKSDTERAQIVERAYADIVASGEYSYSRLAETLVRTTLGQPARGIQRPAVRVARILSRWNRLDEMIWPAIVRAKARIPRGRVRHCVVTTRNRFLGHARPLVSRLIGEDRLRRMLASVRRNGNRSAHRSHDPSVDTPSR